MPYFIEIKVSSITKHSHDFLYHRESKNATDSIITYYIEDIISNFRAAKRKKLHLGFSKTSTYKVDMGCCWQGYGKQTFSHDIADIINRYRFGEKT